MRILYTYTWEVDYAKQAHQTFSRCDILHRIKERVLDTINMSLF